MMIAVMTLVAGLNVGASGNPGTAPSTADTEAVSGVCERHGKVVPIHNEDLCRERKGIWHEAKVSGETGASGTRTDGGTSQEPTHKMDAAPHQ